MIIGHSLLQYGPTYPVLAPSVYNYICTASEDTVMQSTNMLPCIDNIPRDASTTAIHDLIHKVCTLLHVSYRTSYTVKPVLRGHPHRIG
jgi:hypothetical protein